MPEQSTRLPVVAIVGRPNVGKSTLVNRILGRREAVVEDQPGVTRDRVSYEANWAGRDFRLVDTGGWERDAAGIYSDVAEQAARAAADADVIAFVVDATVGPTDADENAVAMLRSVDAPVVLVANKVDSAVLETEAANLWSLGIGEPIVVSALHGRGSGDLLDVLVSKLPPADDTTKLEQRPVRVALLGRPNVGKSSLLNALSKSDRSVVNSAAGTTVDPVDELIELGGEVWEFVDTAGIRRKTRTASGPEWFASLRTYGALERSDICLLLLDASEGISEQDVRIANRIVEAGRAMVIVVNKWDLLDEDSRHQFERQYERDLAQVSWAPRVNVSALTRWHVDKLAVRLREALEGWRTRVSTGKLNQFFADIVAEHPHPIRGGKQARILYGTQPSTEPPTFVLFTNGFLESNYRRFIERRLRESFGFVGTPIVIEMRVKEKRRK